MLALYLPSELVLKCGNWQDIRDCWGFDGEEEIYSGDINSDITNYECACGHSIKHIYIATRKDDIHAPSLTIGSCCLRKYNFISAEEFKQLKREETNHRDNFICKQCKKRQGDRKSDYNTVLEMCDECITAQQRKKTEKSQNKVINIKYKCAANGCNKILDGTKHFPCCWSHRDNVLPQDRICSKPNCVHTIISSRRSRFCVYCELIPDTSVELTNRKCGNDECDNSCGPENWKIKCTECYYSDKLKERNFGNEFIEFNLSSDESSDEGNNVSLNL